MPASFWDSQDTIVARASAPGGGVRGVIRVSGPDAVRIVAGICEPADAIRNLSFPASVAVTVRLSELESSAPARALVWPDKRSYTRQPSVELHTIGAPPVLEAIHAALAVRGARTAEPGEFTLRAFLAGRLDLTQAEAVLGVIDASGRDDLDVALEQLAGGLTTPLDSIRDCLLDLLAQLEAGLDFVDEDIEFVTASELEAQLAAALDELETLQRQLETRQDFAERPMVALCGPPNVGKSSLFNALLGRDASIVSASAGATRDYVGQKLQLDATRSCTLIDTAGADRRGQGSDALAQQTSQSASRQAAVRLLCTDQDHTASASQSSVILVLTKADLRRCERDAPNGSSNEQESSSSEKASQSPTSASQSPTIALGAAPVRTSATTGEGIDELRTRIASALQSVSASHAQQGVATRCGGSLRSVGEALARARSASKESAGEELVAAELRLALDELGRVVGTIYNDDVLDRVFSRFCIGK